MQPNGGQSQGFSSGRGGGSRRGGGPMRYQNQGFQNNRQQMGGYFQQDFNGGAGNQGADSQNQFNNQTPGNQYMSSSPQQTTQDSQSSRGSMYQGGRGGRGGNDYQGRGGRGGSNDYSMRMPRRGGYQNNDRGGGMGGGSMSEGSTNYYSGGPKPSG